DQARAGQALQALVALQRFAQVLVGNARVLAHQRLGARAFALHDGVQHRAVLGLRDDERVPGGGAGGGGGKKALGEGNGSVFARSSWRATRSLPAISESRSWKRPFCST